MGESNGFRMAFARLSRSLLDRRIAHLADVALAAQRPRVQLRAPEGGWKPTEE